MRYLICGLPRSRTAWWSLATTTAQSTCAHEPLRNCENFAALKAQWHGAATYVGVSDSGVVPVLGRILEEVQPQTLIVRRDPASVLLSLERCGLVTDEHRAVMALLNEMARVLDEFAAHQLVEVVQFDALKDVDVVEDCFRWLLPDNPSPFNRDLMHMNCQVDREYLQAQMNNRKPLWVLEALRTWQR